jgi:hypothetical protein
LASAADADRLRDVRTSTSAGGSCPRDRTQRLVEVPGETDETIVVCAHYDSAWRAGGAVDNAGGVEGVRRIVERLTERPHRRTLLAIAFGAEELGLSGSRYFVQDAKTRGELHRIKGVVNLECLARGRRLDLWAAPEDMKERGLRIAAELGLGDLPTRQPIAKRPAFKARGFQRQRHSLAVSRYHCPLTIPACRRSAARPAVSWRRDSSGAAG